jgi:hypothetical protein
LARRGLGQSFEVLTGGVRVFGKHFEVLWGRAVFDKHFEVLWGRATSGLFFESLFAACVLVYISVVFSGSVGTVIECFLEHGLWTCTALSKIF